MANDLVPKSVAAIMARRRAEAKAWKPWGYQEWGLKLMLEDPRCGLLLDPGMGKSSTTLAAIKILLKRRLIKRALVLAPLRAVYDVWPMEAVDWSDFHNLGVAILHGPGKDKALRQLTPAHQLCLMNPEGADWLFDDPKRMKALGADMLVVDECFAAGTLVATPAGQVQIETLRPGDVVCTEFGPRKVTRVTSNIPKGDVVEVCVNNGNEMVQRIRCTADHPFFTELGWLPAKYLEGRRTFDLAAVRDMRGDDEAVGEAACERFGTDLFAILREEVDDPGARQRPRKAQRKGEGERPKDIKAPVARAKSPDRRASNFGWKTADYLQSAVTARMAGLRDVRTALQEICLCTGARVRAVLLKVVRAGSWLEEGRPYGWISSRSYAGASAWEARYAGMEQGNTLVERDARSLIGHSEAEWSRLERAWGKWERNVGGGSFGERSLAEEVYVQLRGKIGRQAAWLSYLLQSGLRRPKEYASGGSGRREPQAAYKEGGGREEGNQVARTRVESVSCLERGSVPLVYNLEVEGCPHFEVAGCALVHNSSKWKNSNTVRFKRIRKALAQFSRRHILTGSPRPKSYMDLFSQIYILDRGAALGSFVSHYRNQYFFPTGYQMREWEILPGAAEQIDARIAPMVLRLDAKDYLKLPETPPDDVRRVDLPPAVRKEYDKLEDSLMSTLFSAPLVNSAAARSKCAQMANGAVYVDSPDEETWRRERPVKTLHSAKVDALVELYEELQGEPLMVSIGFQHDVAAIRKALSKGIPCINGGVSRGQASQIIADWNAGKLPMLMLHPQSAGHGLNLQGSACRHVCFFDLPDDFDGYDQLFRRVWRQGNKADFVLRHLIVVRNTVDEAKLRNLRKKGSGQKAFLDAMRDYAREKGLVK